MGKVRVKLGLEEVEDFGRIGVEGNG